MADTDKKIVAVYSLNDSPMEGSYAHLRAKFDEILEKPQILNLHLREGSAQIDVDFNPVVLISFDRGETFDISLDISEIQEFLVPAGGRHIDIKVSLIADQQVENKEYFYLDAWHRESKSDLLTEKQALFDSIDDNYQADLKVSAVYSLNDNDQVNEGEDASVRIKLSKALTVDTFISVALKSEDAIVNEDFSDEVILSFDRGETFTSIVNLTDVQKIRMPAGSKYLELLIPTNTDDLTENLESFKVEAWYLPNELDKNEENIGIQDGPANSDYFKVEAAYSLYSEVSEGEYAQFRIHFNQVLREALKLNLLLESQTATLNEDFKGLVSISFDRGTTWETQLDISQTQQVEVPIGARYIDVKVATLEDSVQEEVEIFKFTSWHRSSKSDKTSVIQTLLSSNISGDTNKPNIYITRPDTNSYFKDSLNITLSFNDEDSQIDTTSLEVMVNGQTLDNCQSTQTDAVCSYIPHSSDQQVEITAKIADTSGNLSIAEPVYIELDDTAPTVAITSPSTGVVVNKSFNLTLTAEDTASGIDYFNVYTDNELSASSCTPNGIENTYLCDVSITQPLNEFNIVYISVKDSLGNTTNTSPIKLFADYDSDGYANKDDAFPTNGLWHKDSDGDGVGDSSDSDRDGDGVPNKDDEFPDNRDETTDSDGDGIGNNSDPDRDGDGVNNELDEFPDDPSRTRLPKVVIDSPKDLTTLGTTPVLVTGRVLDVVAGVLTINGQTVAHSNNEFTVSVPLIEGHNSIIARVVDSKGEVGTDLVDLSLDKTPPQITIESHINGQIVYQNTVDVSGLVNDLSRGTVSGGLMAVMVNGITAQVGNRSYIARNIILEEGENTLVVTASDPLGNTDNKIFTLVYEKITSKKLVVVSGQNLTGMAGTQLTQPLSVKLVDEQLQILANEKVIFRVIKGEGNLTSVEGQKNRGLIVNTNDQGIAAVRFNIGSRVGMGNQQVRAKAVGAKGEIIFSASVTPRAASVISIVEGNNQIGTVSQPLPRALVIAVQDDKGNFIKNTQVSFKVTRGDVNFGINAADEKIIEITVITDNNGRALANVTLGKIEGRDVNTVTAYIKNTEIQTSFNFGALIPKDSGITSISGVVLDNQEEPVPNVTVFVEGTSRQTKTNAAGEFKVTDVPVGPVHIIVDGSTTSATGDWPTLSYNLVTVAGVDTPMSKPVYLLKLDNDNAVWVGNEDKVIQVVGVPGFALNVKKDSVIFPDGSKQGKLSITQVNSWTLPMTPPYGIQPAMVFTIQPHGTQFNPPAPISLPNTSGALAGDEIEIYSFDHDINEFITVGLGTVSEDGAVINSNPGVGIVKAGWGFSPPTSRPAPSSNGGNNNNKKKGDGGDCGSCQVKSGSQCIANDRSGVEEPFDDCFYCKEGNPTPKAQVKGNILITQAKQLNDPDEWGVMLDEKAKTAEVDFNIVDDTNPGRCEKLKFFVEINGTNGTKKELNGSYTHQFKEAGKYEVKLSSKCNSCPQEFVLDTKTVWVLDVKYTYVKDGSEAEFKAGDTAYITKDPKMPQVKVQVLPKDYDELMFLQLEVVDSFLNTAGRRFRMLNGNADNIFDMQKIVQGDDVFGGQAKLKVKIGNFESKEFEFDILGLNPDTSDVGAYIASKELYGKYNYHEPQESAANGGWVPYMKALTRHESDCKLDFNGWRSQAQFIKGVPNIASDNGVGMLQITDAHRQDIQVYWNWKDNIYRGREVLNIDKALFADTAAKGVLRVTYDRNNTDAKKQKTILNCKAKPAGNKKEPWALFEDVTVNGELVQGYKASIIQAYNSATHEVPYNVDSTGKKLKVTKSDGTETERVVICNVNGDERELGRFPLNYHIANDEKLDSFVGATQSSGIHFISENSKKYVSLVIDKKQRGWERCN